MLYVPTAIRSEATRESKMTNEDKIREVLFQLGTEMKLHKIDNDNFILEIDYEKYVKLILGVIGSTPESLK